MSGTQGYLLIMELFVSYNGDASYDEGVSFHVYLVMEVWKCILNIMEVGLVLNPFHSGCFGLASSELAKGMLPRDRLSLSQ